jgi:DNA-binding Lrp family transcriptional regulator
MLNRIKELDELGIAPGDIIVVDTDPSTIAGIQTADPVIAELRLDRRGDGAVPVLRQFLEPDLLTTNSRTANALPVNRKDGHVAVRGRVLHHIRAIRR